MTLGTSEGEGMSSCPDFEDLSCYIDEELDAARSSVVREHVDSCERCAGLTARLRREFDGVAANAEPGVAGAGCSDEEGLILYLTRDLADADRRAVEAHLSRCDACVYGLSLLKRRLRVESSVDRPVPAALRRQVQGLIEAGARDLADQPRAVESTNWLHRVRETLDRTLRLPVLVPAAVAAGALLVVGVQNQQVLQGSDGIRAIERSAVMRVTAPRALVREVPRAQGGVVSELRLGDRVEVAGEDRDWYRVLLSENRSGWVEREAFE